MRTTGMTSSTDDFLPDVNAFRSIEISVEYLQNTITRTEVPNPRDVQVIEHLDRGFVLEVPPRLCALKHVLLLKIGLSLPGEKEPQNFTFTGRVDHHEEDPDGTQLITLTLVQFEEKAWEKIQNSLIQRQEEVTDFLLSVKGLT